MNRHDALLLEFFGWMDEKAGWIGAALEKLSPSGEQDQKAINLVYAEGVAAMAARKAAVMPPENDQ